MKKKHKGNLLNHPFKKEEKLTENYFDEIMQDAEAVVKTQKELIIYLVPFLVSVVYLLISVFVVMFLDKDIYYTLHVYSILAVTAVAYLTVYLINRIRQRRNKKINDFVQEILKGLDIHLAELCTLRLIDIQKYLNPNGEPKEVEFKITFEPLMSKVLIQVDADVEKNEFILSRKSHHEYVRERCKPVEFTIKFMGSEILSKDDKDNIDGRYTFKVVLKEHVKMTKGTERETAHKQVLAFSTSLF